MSFKYSSYPYRTSSHSPQGLIYKSTFLGHLFQNDPNVAQGLSKMLYAMLSIGVKVKVQTLTLSSIVDLKDDIVFLIK